MTTDTAKSIRATAADTRIQYLPGVGPQRALAFERLGIMTVSDLLRHYPRTYLDARRFVRIGDLKPGDLVTVVATVKSAAAHRTRGGRTDFSMSVADGSGTLGCYFFGQPFLNRVLKTGTQVVLSGELDPRDRCMHNPMFEVIEEEMEQLIHAGRMVPVHGLTRGLTARGVRRFMRTAVDRFADSMPDPIPASVRATQGFPPLADSLRAIHFPENDRALVDARRHLAFEELFLLQTVLDLRRRVLDESGRGLAIEAPGELAKRTRAALPFQLTTDQDTALGEIVADLRRERSMQRLLLGDVGSGKTIVAFLAALHAIEAGHQVAFMAPTEILARQHGLNLSKLGTAIGVDVAMLTGGTPTDARRAIAARLDAETPMLLVGTHALLEETVRIPKLALAIVDEQHRFGVRQRAVLAKKTVLPDVLVLTATPIPRTLTLATYGDLDVSRLRARPAGRGRMVTRIAGEEKFPQVIEFLAKELEAGRQAFVVVPLIEEGESGERPAATKGHKAAEAEYERLSQHPLLAKFRLGLLHGRLKSAEKQSVMDGFVAGRLNALVATTVVEVGVDVPNATVMVIENADRFGLTQLHQLRGRVGRGTERSVCVLVPSPGASALANQRLDVLIHSEDGFEIAEADLRLRGPGELWGVRQSGIPRFRVADLVRDEALLEQAHAAAHEVVKADPLLRSPDHANLRAALLASYSEPLELALAG
jgi:ATP-dependent DNA helicase RecG